MKQSLILLACTISIFKGTAQEIKMGCYYYDGWNGKTPVSSKLIDSFAERKSKWGWNTSSQSVMDQEIQAASDAGLYFFSFCWYYSGKDKYQTDPLNNALKLYQNSKYNSQLKYCLMVSNHTGFILPPADWSAITADWISQFKSERYLRINGKPVIIFFSIKTLVTSFGSSEKVKAAIDSFRLNAKTNGIDGINLAVCTNGSNTDKETVQFAQSCGFDMITGYNYHTIAFNKREVKIPIDSLQAAEQTIWTKTASIGNSMKYIPVCTINWDPRPWASKNNDYSSAPYYIGLSPTSVYHSVRGCISWMEKNTSSLPEEKVAIIYAWNEYGEGAYLTPSNDGTNLLDGVKKALKN